MNLLPIRRFAVVAILLIPFVLPAQEVPRAIRRDVPFTNAIRRALKVIPTNGQPGKTEPDEVVRAKSLLIFFALRDRYGDKAFSDALSHMLYARRRGGFDITDMISAFDQETHQNVGEFVRHWMKRSGVPQDFRARYEGETSAGAVALQNSGLVKETMP